MRICCSAGWRQFRISLASCQSRLMQGPEVEVGGERPRRGLCEGAGRYAGIRRFEYPRLCCKVIDIRFHCRYDKDGWDIRCEISGCCCRKVSVRREASLPAGAFVTKKCTNPTSIKNAGEAYSKDQCLPVACNTISEHRIII